jgi:hypothetical protein
VEAQARHRVLYQPQLQVPSQPLCPVLNPVMYQVLNPVLDQVLDLAECQVLNLVECLVPNQVDRRQWYQTGRASRRKTCIRCRGDQWRETEHYNRWKHQGYPWTAAARAPLVFNKRGLAKELQNFGRRIQQPNLSPGPVSDDRHHKSL